MKNLLNELMTTDVARTSANLLKYDLKKWKPFFFDFTDNNLAMKAIDPGNLIEFSNYVFGEIGHNDVPVGIGRYAEDRTIYRKSSLFESDIEARTIHLGVDLFITAEEKVFAPLPARIHSFNNNNNFGDYGPTIILEHCINGLTFHTLYGHLATSSLKKIKIGQIIEQGQAFASIGHGKENGNWPPHLHFQIISDIQDYKGDYPGVCSISNKNKYLELCPHPNLIIGIEAWKDLEV